MFNFVGSGKVVGENFLTAKISRSTVIHAHVLYTSRRAFTELEFNRYCLLFLDYTVSACLGWSPGWLGETPVAVLIVVVKTTRVFTCKKGTEIINYIASSKTSIFD